MSNERFYGIEGKFKKVCAYAVYFSGLYYIIGKVITLFNRNKGLYIFLYHRIGSRGDDHYEHNLTVRTKTFIRQLRFFRQGFQCVSMTEALALLKKKEALKRDLAVLTLDDGYRDNFEKGLELFREYGIQPVIYLVAGAVENRAPLWTEAIDSYLLRNEYRDRVLDYFGFSGEAAQTNEAIFRYSEKIKNRLKKMSMPEVEGHIGYLNQTLPLDADNRKSGLMSWDEAAALAAAGCELGSHTLSHVNLAAEPEGEVIKEVVEAGKLIGKRTGTTVRHFAYPYGKREHFSKAVIECVKKHYESAVTAIEGINRMDSDVYTLRRIIIDNKKDIVEFKVRLLYLKLKNLTGKV